MALNIGQINHLMVKRETDISYTLTDGLTNVFLHFNQTEKKLNPGDEVLAFLYYDQKKRLCATLQEPLITTTKPGKVEVVNINHDAGVFISIGIVKDILLSKDYLPNDFKAWPQIGDYIYCILKEKYDQLVARLMQKEDIDKPNKQLEIGDTVNATINRITDDGIGLYTDDLHYIFIHKSLTRKKYRLGEVIEVKIININKDEDYNATTIAQKEIVRLSDSEYILRALKGRGGVLPFGNNSLPETIQKEFRMSKSAFKRAIGHLYKERLIQVDDNRISLIENEEN